MATNLKNTARRGSRTHSSPESAEKLLNSLLSDKKIKQKADSVSFLERWSEIVGEALANVSKPERLKSGLLTVRVIDAAYAQELSMNRFGYLEKLTELGYAGTVSDIKFISGNKRDFGVR